MPEELTRGTSVAVRTGLEEEITAGYELAPAADAAAAAREVETRILTAKKWPRSVEKFREDILHSCKRPGFANIALFTKPVGRERDENGQWVDKEVTDFSIRFIETALQYYGNVHVASKVPFENDKQAKIAVGVLDCQHNTGYMQEAIVPKLVERRSVKAGRKSHGTRINSYGDEVHLVEATDAEFRNAFGAERSKLIRDLGKRLLPRDILDEARTQIDLTLADETAKDPDAAKKKVLDKFAAVGVSATDLIAYLKRPLESLTVKDLQELGKLYNALKEGEVSWAEVVRPPGPQPAGAQRPTARDRVMGQASFLDPEKKPEEGQQ